MFLIVTMWMRFVWRFSSTAAIGCEKLRTTSGQFRMRGQVPPYFSALTEADRGEYWALQDRLLKFTDRRSRGHRLSTLADILSAVRAYAQRGDRDDGARCCVCGVCFLPSGIGVNSHQLHFLTNRCKSSINGALKLMGYSIVSARGDVNPELVTALPDLRGKTHDLRLWSVRKPPGSTPCERCQTETENAALPSCLPKIDDCDLSLISLFNGHEELTDRPFGTFDYDGGETDNEN
jgi:hypothetical protein